MILNVKFAINKTTSHIPQVDHRALRRQLNFLACVRFKCENILLFSYKISIKLRL